jgi:hypothetical protein
MKFRADGKYAKIGVFSVWAKLPKEKIVKLVRDGVPLKKLRRRINNRDKQWIQSKILSLNSR